MKPDLVDDIFSFLSFCCAFYFNSRWINAASEITFVGKYYMCVIWKQNLQKLICVFHFLWLIPVVFQFCLLPKVAVADLIFFFLYSELQMLPQVVKLHQKTTVFIVSNGGIDTVSLHSLNFCLLLTNKVRHLHWIIVIQWQG